LGARRPLRARSEKRISFAWADTATAGTAAAWRVAGGEAAGAGGVGSEGAGADPHPPDAKAKVKAMLERAGR
jgi:hypothetical protein